MSSEVMECDICCEEYNDEERIPKTVVPCGHPVCLQCLQRTERRACPTCRTAYRVSPSDLPNNFSIIRLMGNQGNASGPTRTLDAAWCLDCRAPATCQCLAEHALLNPAAALRRALQDVPPLTAEALQGQCRGEQTLQALTLLAGDTWNLTLEGGGRVLKGTLQNTDDPTVKALCVLAAAGARLVEEQAAAQAPPLPPAAAPAAVRPRPGGARELNLLEISQYGGRPERTATLVNAVGVTRLENMFCHVDAEWSFTMLRHVAPTVEELDLLSPSVDHLATLTRMPRLYRLRIHYSLDWYHRGPLSVLAPGNLGLRWLHVTGLPRHQLAALLQAHAGTLETLWLFVGTEGAAAASRRPWSWTYYDLEGLLEGADLRALRRLVLLRAAGVGQPASVPRVTHSHSPADCAEQRGAVRRVLPAAQVLCASCEPVEHEAF